MSTRLSNAWTKVLAQQQRIEQLEQERQERIKQKQAKRERVIDADLNPSVEFSSFPERSYKFLDESKAGASRTKRNSQPRPRRLERLKNKIQDFGADSNNSNSNTRPAEDSVIKIESDDNGSDNSVDDEDEGLSLLRRPGNQMSLLDKFEFCRVHVAEARIVPLGIQNNYPFYIKFHELSKRVSKIESQLRCIIEGTVSSTFLDMALNQYKQLGTQGARNPHVIMANVERTMPGYYGSKGSAELSKILARMFLETNILTHERARPQTPIEYIQHVLVPEAGLRLIAEDQAKIMRGSSDLKEGKDHSVITLEEARLIMQESVEFGNYMHDVELH
ncbi:hypothetical protein BCR41DRAFT_372737 [Lobosporangium transversale]|uniref:Restriction of telomere capping protein 4 n=1 Tax=Lobosporangium transversale TaxID=64571 RepID=A0A1Y2GFV5_9FUNG|nr:hypothetical protein BCR41DRAFT_372737 [Lobosporangium transversale]ORZ09711.1 hypothetical protein BCR41DRAFT_372737 [Lobosporangium transversale]|eukprot:XP_021878981.1 hypothetical protein BCR41DRAFT_372737 [Lobosporangium transversale]